MVKKALKYLLWIVTGFLIVTTVYSIHEIITAREYTKTVILPDLQASQWRQPNGVPHKFELTIHDLSDWQKQVIIKVQDPGFYRHNGMDLSTPGAGLTTVSQAIVKKLYFENFKPGLAKFKQTLIAVFAVDNLIGKDAQLTLFVNMMYFGNCKGKPVIGLDSAAQAYYGQPVAYLTEDQYISLIAMIVMPSTFHVLDHPEWNRDRTNRIKKLVAGEYNPKGLMDQFYGELPQDVIDNGLPPASYFGGSTK